ncbi:Antitoxin of toxin-antitoxin stability system [Actinomyces bovis]|uniref:Antitoxin n=1 Tax=Actinomyces bovis TaxID=1658 RepID=A0ABY1VNN2_9ACTO|nr:type II toxin-antitoxin system prevent-host-death family antitoxin [Actinomyces bovis]SPT53067.1 Antitoxin of toxin-antitoxin stability system [Actinomyces bovis]VEG52988.1 Antitoxin of toxin-antitoxin stability system [Actinomyces israelii]
MNTKLTDTTVKVQQAKTHLSSLLAKVETGATITIARGSTQVARLVPIQTCERELGFGGYHLPDSFFEDLPEEELTAWEAR